jgi:hypothetical protein
VPQPLFRLVAPTEDATDVPFKAPRLVVATDADSFGAVEHVRLVPESGKTLELRTQDVSTRSDSLSGIEFTSLYGRPAVLGAISPKNLAPSTTYELVFVVRTMESPGCPEALTERVGFFTTESATALDAFGDFADTPDLPPNGSAATMAGQAIFDRSRDVLRSVRYPTFISFIVHARSNTGGKPFLESFRSIVRSRDDIVLTHKTAIESTSKPDNPNGTNIAIFGLTFPTHTKGYQEEPFGVPQISPLYSFGLRPIGESLPLMPTPEPEPTDLRSLGRVEATEQDYDVTLVGIEKYRVRWVYHLKLVPRQNPDEYRLREMWVDTQTFVPWKLISEGIFPNGPASGVPWTVTYTIAHSYWLMAEETTSSTLRIGGLAQGTSSRSYDGLTYAFSDFLYPSDMQDFSFFDVGSSAAAEY